MKKVLLMAVALAVFAVPAWSAGVDLQWDNCAPSGNASHVMLCGDGGVNTLYASWVQPSDLSNIFVATEFTWDIQTTTSPTPKFWEFQTPTSLSSCNLFYIAYKAKPGTCAATNVWGFNGGAATVTFNYGPQFGGVPNRGRVVGSVYRSSASPTSLTAGTNYYLMHIELYGDATSAGCTGCADPTAIVFNQATVLSLGSAGEDAPIPVVGPGLSSGICATAGNAGSICDATPTKNTTWGTLKSLYR